MSGCRHYRIGEFARLTGVSVRTLHHYDRIGLLRPSERGASGYRLYTEAELLRLQQVLTLRALGFELAEIGALLDQPDFNLIASMRIQRDILREQIAELERVEAALGTLLRDQQARGVWDWQLLAETSAALERRLRRRGVDVNEYYKPEEMQRRMRELAEENDITPEEIHQVEEGWAALIGEIRASYDLDPASPAAQALYDRWQALLEQTMRGFRQDEKLVATISEGYRQGRYAHIDRAPRAEDFAFIERVGKAHGAE
ncbi:MAG TPA: MerR family transcriptional regulator [Thermomicrobiaceae bacterium]|nr:MerR family transcriptional regulator [Thermomicrobiaceae bacterium]